MNKLLIFFILSLFMCNSLFAHTDRIITCKNGKLIGLPKQYQPAELDLDKYRLRIKNHVINISKSAYLNSLFPKNKKYDLDISSSWYHDKSLLPPYIVFHIKPLEKDFSYKILFNMDTLDVMKVTVVLKISSNSTRYMNVMLSKSQKKDIANSIKKVTE